LLERRCQHPDANRSHIIGLKAEKLIYLENLNKGRIMGHEDLVIIDTRRAARWEALFFLT
jgi:hypothetical protein